MDVGNAAGSDAAIGALIDEADSGEGSDDDDTDEADSAEGSDDDDTVVNDFLREPAGGTTTPPSCEQLLTLIEH